MQKMAVRKGVYDLNDPNHVKQASLYQEMKKFSEPARITPSDPDFHVIVKDEIWAVDNLLSKKECEFLIAVSEKAGYITASVNGGGGRGKLQKLFNIKITEFFAKEIRDSERVMIDDQSIADYLLEKCKLFMPAAYGGAVLVGVNERMRFLKYDHPGAKFKNHMDGTFARDEWERSMITIQLYLNEDMEGGHTTFIDEFWKDVVILLI